MLISTNLKTEPLSSQAKLDSLIAELPNAKGDTNEVKLLAQLGDQMSMINPKIGLEYGEQALSLAKQIDWEKGKGWCYYSIAENNLVKSNYPVAIEVYHKAIKIFTKYELKFEYAESLNDIGNVYEAQSNYPKALEYYQKALKINEGLGNKDGIASNLGNIGIIYDYQFNYPKAIEYYQKALKINEELGKKSGVANNLINIGSLYTIINELDKSLDYLTRGLILNEEIGDTRQVTYTYFMLAGNYIARAKQIDKLQSKGETSSNSRLINKDQNYKKALEFGIRAEDLADSIGLGQLQHVIFKEISTAFEGLGQLGKALEYHKKFQLKKDSVFSQENNKKIAALEKARENDVNRIKIEKQEVQLLAQESEKMFIIYSGIGIIAFVISILVLIAYQRKKSDKLLYNVLPISIAKRLKKKEHPISDHFEQASIIFIDIVGFTAMSKDSDPTDIVQALNKVFTHYDSIASKHGLEKIKTIGDCYMAAAGIPVIQKDNTLRAARMAIEVRDYMVDYYTDHGFKLDVRIGLDCGPVVAGVIGEKKFIYDMWSDAVNTASRMESTGQSGSVHISERFKVAVAEFKVFEFEARGEMEVKGKGKMKTFFMGSKAVEAV
jgi:class 3 adenylate cyclase/Tfp pilus assembly protein PilF